MKTKLILTSLLVILSISAFANAPLEEGKSIFTSRCAGCHNVNKVITGPALSGLHERRSMDWIVQFIRSSQTMVKSGDQDAVAIFEKFNKIPMPDHGDLTEENIKSIVEYIKSESRPAEEVKAPFAKPRKKRPDYQPLSFGTDYGLFLALFGAIGLLIGTLLFAMYTRRFEKK